MSYFYPDLKKLYSDLVRTDKKRAAEVAYVMAVKLCQEAEEKTSEGDEKEASKVLKQAEKYAVVSVRLLRKLNIQTLEEAAARFFPTLNDVPIPDLVHDNVIEERLRAIGLNLDGLLN